MDIYAYHLAFGVSKGTVWNAYRFMAEQPPTILWSLMSKISSTFVVGIGDQ